MISRTRRRGVAALACCVLFAVQGCGGAGTSGAPAAPLAVSSVAPGELPLGGGSVTLHGSGFDQGTRVLFGSDAAPTVNFISATELDAVAPPHAAGAVDVEVENPDGARATLPRSVQYVPTPPSLASVSPSTGPIAGGTSVTVAGANFGAGSALSFGGAPATVLSVSPGSIVATTPPHAEGAVDVVVVDADGLTASLAGGFVYTAAALPPPSLASLSPTSGPAAGGTTVTLTGASFDAGATVTFGGAPAVVGAVSPTSLTATAPAHAAGPVSVVVTNPDGQSSTLASGFSYVAAVPPATGVTLAASLPSPQVAGTFIALTAAGVGASGYEYQFWLSADGGLTFALVQDYGVATTWTTPATLKAGTYRVLVDVRTSPLVAFDAQATLDLVLTPAPGGPFITSVSPASGSTSGSTEGFTLSRVADRPVAGRRRRCLLVRA